MTILMVTERWKVWGKKEMEMLEWIPQSSTINLLSTAQIQPWYRSDTGDPQKQRQVICKSQYDQPQVFAEDKKWDP